MTFADERFSGLNATCQYCDLMILDAIYWLYLPRLKRDRAGPGMAFSEDKIFLYPCRWSLWSPELKSVALCRY
jgi:hypothetical protein